MGQTSQNREKNQTLAVGKRNGLDVVHISGREKKEIYMQHIPIKSVLNLFTLSKVKQFDVV